MADNIKHPSHYAEGRKYEPKDVIRDWGLNFNLGNAVKYISRAGRKDDIVQELKKAQEYLQFEIDAIEAEREKALKHECKAPKPKIAYIGDYSVSLVDIIDMGVENFDIVCMKNGAPKELEISGYRYQILNLAVTYRLCKAVSVEMCCRDGKSGDFTIKI